MQQAQPPVRIGQYRLSKTLGIGSFGKVKLATHERTGYKVAIKILNRNKIKKLDMSEKVRREIANLKRFSHPHIIRLYEVIHTPSDIFVVMEYVAGGELFDYIVQKGRLPENEARRFFQQIIAGVEYCHHHGVVHRDLKPENLLLDEEHNVKVADFGLSNSMDDGTFLRTSCGSPNYAAPEVISGYLYAGPEVDVWSCGVILYALLCGSLPFDDESIATLFKKIKGGLYTLPTHLSELSRDIIPRMLVVDPLKRISIEEIRKHPWFRTQLPLYLAIPPAVAEAEAEAATAAQRYRHRLGLLPSLPTISSTSDLTAPAAAAAREGLGIESEADSEIVDMVLRLGFPGVNSAADVEKAVKASGKGKNSWNDVGVAYELLAERKRSRQRAAQIEEARVARETAEANFSPVFGSPTVHAALGPVFQSQHAAAVQAAAAAANARRRRWYLGIQSKKDPSHVMGEVFRALKDAGFEWKAMGPYRVRCRYGPAQKQAGGAGGGAGGSGGSVLSSPGDSSSGAGGAGGAGAGDDDDDDSDSDWDDIQGSDDEMAGNSGSGSGSAAEGRGGAGTARPRRGGAGLGSGSGSGTDADGDAGVLALGPPGPLSPEEKELVRLRRKSRRKRARQRTGYAHVKIGLQLYKVQRGIYLLDLQKLAGDAFSYMNLCARIITELKVPAAAVAATAGAAAAAAADAGMSGMSSPMAVQPSPPGYGSAASSSAAAAAAAAAASAAGPGGGPMGVPPGYRGPPLPGAPGPMQQTAYAAAPGPAAVAPPGMGYGPGGPGPAPGAGPGAPGSVPAPVPGGLQVMAVPGLTPDAPTRLFYLNPATRQPEPLPPHLYAQAMAHMQAQAHAAAVSGMGPGGGGGGGGGGGYSGR